MGRIIILFFVLVTSISTSAQTYYYKYLNTVNSNGMKTKMDNFFGEEDIFMTFVNNGSVLVPFTDENGISKGGVYCNYIGSGNSIITYKGFVSDNAAAWGSALGLCVRLNFKIKMGDERKIKFHFSSDYSRLNIESPSGIIHVLERRVNPKSEQVPNMLY